MYPATPECLPIANLLVALLFAGACGHPSGTPASAPESEPLFHEAAEAAGLGFSHSADRSLHYRLPEIMGAGVALLDFDSDGDLDALLLQGGRLDSRPEQSGGLPSLRGSRLFENRLRPTGQFQFRDVTEQSGLAFGGYAMGVAVGDYDGDRDPDVYVTALGPNALFENTGGGRFARVPGPQDERWSSSATFLDYDGDGDLDLFFANYVDFSLTNNKRCFSPAGARDYCNPTVYNALPDRLFRNDGGRFTEVTDQSGLGRSFGNGLGVITADLNTDGLPDLYVANDGTENQLWASLGGGRFENRAMLAGAAVNADGLPEAGMGVAAADFDADGDYDLLLTHNSLETNTLYLNSGKGLFVDATNRLGLGISSVPFTGFGLSWNDFDNDGFVDVFIANGAVVVQESLRGSQDAFVQHNQYYRGSASGFSSVDGRQVWGAITPLVGRGLATGDVDSDGDLDILVSNNSGAARLYLNQSGGERSVRVQLRADSPNTYGIGATVGLHFQDGSSVWRRVHRDGSYLSSSEPVAHFGISPGSNVSHAEVHWPGAGTERFPAPLPGALTTLRQGDGQALPR